MATRLVLSSQRLMLLAVALSLLGCARFPDAPPDTFGPITPTVEPLQSPIPHPAPFHLDRSEISFTLTPRFNYRLHAVVLHRERYSLGWQADLAPCDLALGWGDLIARGLHHQVRWSQGGRWYRWRIRADFPENNSYVAHRSANTHILPASETIAAAVCALEPDDEVALDGMLVDVRGLRGSEQYLWKTSTSRDDRADGSCEVMWVTRLRARGRLFE